MSSSDGPDAHISWQSQKPAARVDTLLVESLCYLLIEKGVLTKNDALSVVQTVAEVKRGEVEDRGEDGGTAADLDLLRRIFVSFEALDDTPGAVNFDAGNVHRLRPPLHGDRPEFPDHE